MIKISKQTDYALQFLIELSKLDKDKLLGLKVFSNKSNISFLFLQKIAKSMREAGLIDAVKGKSGGYKLNKPIEKISLKEVIESIDGAYGATECSTFSKHCQKSAKCSIKQGLDKVNKEIVKYLEKTTVKSMIN